MQIQIEHDTTIRYAAQDEQIVQAWRVWPASSSSQTINEWQVHIDGRRVQAHYQDGFGNYLATRTITGAEPVQFRIRGRVQTFARAGIHQSEEQLPEVFFSSSTSLTVADAAIRTLASEITEPMLSIDRLTRLVKLLRERVEYSPANTGEELSADQALAAGSGRAQDHAHILIAVAQAAGLPARCVTGYRRASAADCATHVWSEVFLNELGWVGIDVVNGCVTDERYVRVASGRDIRDAAPVRAVAIGHLAEVLELTNAATAHSPATPRVSHGQSRNQSQSQQQSLS